MWLIKASLRNPYMVATIVFMLLVLGVVSLRGGILGMEGIPEDILPVFKAPAVQVITYFQGMPASSIEKTITNRIERWVNQAPGAMKLESKSIPGVSVVRVYFRDDVDPTAALTMTSQLALGTLPTLPPNTLPPVVLPFDPTGTMPLGVLTVENKTLDEANVKDVARIQVRNFLGQVKGAVAPVVVGGKDRTVLIYLDPKRMEVRKLSMLDVVDALKKNNMMVTPGIAYFGANQLLLDTNMMVEKVQELDDMPIRAAKGAASILLKDVGHVEDSFAIQTSRVRIASEKTDFQGRRQVYVPIYRQQGASSLAVAEGVKANLSKMEQVCPPGTSIKFVMDQSVYVEEAIHSLIHEGIIGAALVSLMILIFLGNWRMTLIASMSIPLALLGAIIGLRMTGNTINVMTLSGLALAIGPLVDDAIVELENNHRNYSLGKSRIRAALDGCAEVMIPVLVATFTTNIVLAPVAMMPGMGGSLFKPLALSVTFAMVTSFILSRTFVPMMCAKFLPDEHLHRRRAAAAAAAAGTPAVAGAPASAAEPVVAAAPAASQTAHAGHGGHGGHGEHELPTTFWGRVHHKIEAFLDRLTLRYQALLGMALRHRALVLGVIGALFVGSLYLGTKIGREFFPQVDAGQITMYIHSPSYMRLNTTEKQIVNLEDFIRHQIPRDELEMVVTEMGVDPDWSSAYTPNSGQQDAVVRIQLTEKRKLSSQEYAEKLRHALAEAARKYPDFASMRVSFNTGGMVSTALNNGASSPIDIQVGVKRGSRQYGLDFAKKVFNKVRSLPGVADARVLQRLDAPYLMIDVDRIKALEVGLSPREVILQAVAALNSSISIDRNFWIDVKTGNQYFVAVQYSDNKGMKQADLLNIEATGTNQKEPVKLSSLAKFRRTSGAVEITHEDLVPIFNVQLNTEGKDIGSVAREVERAIEPVREEAKQLPKKTDNKVGISIEMKGEFEKMNESFSNLLSGLLFASVLVYLLQVALFRSWVGPFIIMFTVPLGLIGVITILYLTNTTLNVQSEMGCIFLVGIAVNNGVLLVDFANKQRKSGLPIQEAITAAAGIRFRPIVMTFLATFLDLIPMGFPSWFGMARGGEATIPLARAVVGGLLTSTCLTLFVVPIMYTLLLREGDDTEADIEAELADEPAPAPVPVVATAAPSSPLVTTAPQGPAHDGNGANGH